MAEAKLKCPSDRQGWKKLLPKGLFYTSKQVSLKAVIREVTARRWLQKGLGQGRLEMRTTGIRKRYRVKEK